MVYAPLRRWWRWRRDGEGLILEEVCLSETACIFVSSFLCFDSHIFFILILVLLLLLLNNQFTLW